MDYEYTIIGGGIVGLILFKELLNKNKKVCLIESNNNDLNKGYISSNSFPHDDLDKNRFRGLGGTSHKWGGGCVLFEPKDFEKWPFDYDFFMKYYIKAAKLFNINLEKYIDKNMFNTSFTSNIFKESCYYSTNLVGYNTFVNHLFNTNTLRELLNKHTIINYTLVKINKKTLLIKNINNDIKNIPYKNCILCCGGLECPKILLESGFTNNNIGKYYSSHINVSCGNWVLNKNIIKDFTHNKETRYFLYKKNNKNIIRVLNYNNKMVLQSDQTPNIHSGITLSEDMNTLLSKKIVLTHDIIKTDLENIVECYKDLNIELINNNIGHIENIPTINNLKKYINGTSHHLGMTRMGEHKQDSVVDNMCKVHNTDNVFILSTSVFPSYSHAQPTFTLVALIYYFLDIHSI